MNNVGAERHPRKNRLRRALGVGVHLGRVAVFVAIVILIRQRHEEFRAERALRRTGIVSLDRVKPFYPNAAAIERWDLERGGQIITGADGKPLGYIIQTSPSSDDIVGYSGPTNTLIAFDNQSRILGIDILESGDTAEHVAAVRADLRFMRAFQGHTWQEIANRPGIDGVSGATLTSLAMAEAISHRLGAPRPSLRFPRPLAVSELTPFLGTAQTGAAHAITQRSSQPALFDVFDKPGRRIGSVLRTSPITDGLSGYQGPTDTLIFLDRTDRVVGLAIRGSYDNEPYVRYVREDEYFGALFNGLTLDELAAFDLEQAEVEGVSGATMTSMAVAAGVPRAAQSALIRKPMARPCVVSLRDAGTVAVLLSALVMCFTHLRGRPRLRIAYRLVLVIYLGFINGDMVSQALLAGWAQNSIPWRLAPGLVLLAGAALLVPIGTKRQLYCHHICPFGAAQYLVRNRLPWRAHLARRARKCLLLIPASLLLLVVVTAQRHLPIDLAAIEPFNAFTFRVAGLATLAIAVGGLVAAALVPMAYCRYGCPTGAVLGFLRFSARSDRISRRDLFALLVLVLAAFL